VNWDDVDLFESTFNAFDAAGIKVWLQVEPASCDVPMLIDLLYQQYGHHPSVIGFGVDDEWYRKEISRLGKPITDAEATAWVAQVRSYDPNDLVLVKHWLTEKMPPTYRDGLVFVDDSQGHGSLANMVKEFEVWGDTFAPAPVGFQFGYVSDKKWWSALADPPRDIGNALLSRDPEHARPALGRLHRLRDLAARVGELTPRDPRRWRQAVPSSHELGFDVLLVVLAEPCAILFGTSPTPYWRALPLQGGSDMSTEQNKAVVRRFITEVLVGGNVDLVDDLLAANYVNRGMGGVDRAAFKAFLTVASAGPGGRMEIKDLVAEGDAVVARFTYEITLPTGEQVTARGLTYYGLADGRIVEDDPITTPDLTQVFADQMPAPAS
jgi:predicted ester cyclase